MQVARPLLELIKQSEIIYGSPAVVELNHHYKQDIIDHLVSLPMEDRALRFYSPVNDSYIERYVENQIKWDTDKCFAIFNDEKIVAFLHLGIRERVTETAVNAEIGVSVNREYRGKGFAKKLMSRVLNYCLSNSIQDLHMECLRENKIMQGLAKYLNMETFIEEDSVVAKLDIDIDNWMDRRFAKYNEVLYRNVGLVDRAAYNSVKVLIASMRA